MNPENKKLASKTAVVTLTVVGILAVVALLLIALGALFFYVASPA